MEITARQAAHRLLANGYDYDEAEGVFLDHVTPALDEVAGDEVMRVLDEVYGR